METLIKIVESNGQKLVSARELHQFLEIRSRFADWIKNRIEKYGFMQNFDYTTVSKNLENGGRELDYALTLDMSKELAMVEGNAKGKEARLYFIACERTALQMAISSSPASSQMMQQFAHKQAGYEQQLRQLQVRTKLLESKLSLNQGHYFTILGYTNMIRKTISVHQAQSFGKKAVALSHELGYQIKKVRDVRFGLVNAYAINVLKKIIT